MQHFGTILFRKEYVSPTFRPNKSTLLLIRVAGSCCGREPSVSPRGRECWSASGGRGHRCASEVCEVGGMKPPHFRGLATSPRSEVFEVGRRTYGRGLPGRVWAGWLSVFVAYAGRHGHRLDDHGCTDDLDRVDSDLSLGSVETASRARGNCSRRSGPGLDLVQRQCALGCARLLGVSIEVPQQPNARERTKSARLRGRRIGGRKQWRPVRAYDPLRDGRRRPL